MEYAEDGKKFEKHISWPRSESSGSQTKSIKNTWINSSVFHLCIFIDPPMAHLVGCCTKLFTFLKDTS